MDAASQSTSIFVFQQKESLAGFAERCGHVSEQEFLSRHPDPFLLTSMPTDQDHAAWSFVIPVRRKPPKIAFGDEVKASSNRVIVGRGPECDVVLAPKSISRRHAVFEKKADVWHFVDLGSTNGTKIEGKVLAPKTPVAIRSSPVKLELGSDVTMWFLLPEDIYAYVSCFTQQLSDTSQTKLPAAGTDTKVSKKDQQTPSENSFLAELSPTPPDPKPDPARAKIAEAETGPLYRPKDPQTTWSDEDTEEKRVVQSRPAQAPGASDHDEKLIEAAVRAITALDSLIMTVSVQFKADSRTMTIFSSQTKGKITDVADHISRLGPLMKSVSVTLTIGDGRPVEIYTAA